MYYYIYADKDATIYSDDFKDSYKKNTGLDEILEVRKDLTSAGTNPKVSRIVIKFDLAEISQSIVQNFRNSN